MPSPQYHATRKNSHVEGGGEKNATPEKPHAHERQQGRRSAPRFHHAPFIGGMSFDEKVKVLTEAGFVPMGKSPKGNPQYGHPENPKDVPLVEVYLPSTRVQQPVERVRHSAAEMFAAAPTAPEPVRVKNGEVVPDGPKHTHKHRRHADAVFSDDRKGERVKRHEKKKSKVRDDDDDRWGRKGRR